MLVATPARANTPLELLEHSNRIYESLTWTQKQRALYFNDYEPAKGYLNNARARNELIARYLRAWHSHVLWLDVDLVDVPSDLIETLLNISDTSIVAPFVLLDNALERKSEHPDIGTPWWINRFYDVGGFVDAFGKNAILQYPYLPEGDVVPMQSVGACYLVPSSVFTSITLPWYTPIDREVEHVTFCAKAREAGVRVFATRLAFARHAFLPLYGLRWNNE